MYTIKTPIYRKSRVTAAVSFPPNPAVNRELTVSDELATSSMVDLAPYLSEIFGEISTVSVLARVAEFVNMLMGVIIFKKQKSIQE